MSLFNIKNGFNRSLQCKNISKPEIEMSRDDIPIDLMFKPM